MGGKINDKKYSEFNEVRFKNIKPKGWLKDTLKCELEGMPGNLHKIGYPYDRECWKYKSLADGGYAASRWNYAVSGWEKPEIIFNKPQEKSMWGFIPFEIKIKARILNNWNLIEVKKEKKSFVDGEGIDDKQVKCGATVVTEDNVLTPENPSREFVEENLGEEREITLIPCGCTNLRLTVFPKHIKYL